MEKINNTANFKLFLRCFSFIRHESEHKQNNF
jgi:hypothetical protein